MSKKARLDTSESATSTEAGEIYLVKDLHLYLVSEFCMEMKVLSKTEFKKAANGKQSHFSLTLSDFEGCILKCACFGVSKTTFNKVDIGKAYRFNNLKCRAVGPQFRTKDTQVQAYVNGHLQFEPYTGETEFQDRVVTESDLSKIGIESITDISGLLYFQEEPRNFLKIHVLRESVVVCVTLFKGKQDAFLKALEEVDSGLVWVSLTNCRASNYASGITLCTTPETSVSCIKGEKPELKDEITFKANIKIGPTIKACFYTKIMEFPNQKYRVTHGVLGTLLPDNFSYTNPLNGKIEWCLKVEVQDESGFVTATAFGEVAKQLLPQNAEYYKKLSVSNPAEVAQAFKLASFKEGVFCLEKTRNGRFTLYDLHLQKVTDDGKNLFVCLLDRHPKSIFPPGLLPKHI